MSNNPPKPSRQSNIELLRMAAAFGVIVQHYNNPRLGGAVRGVAPLSPNGILLGVMHVGMICAVDLFILISGYFMRDSKKRDLLKPVKLLTMMFVFETLFFTFQVAVNGAPCNIDSLLNYFTPNYWFIFVYAALYVISPYINMVWERLSKKNKKILLALSLGLFSVYPIGMEMAGILLGNDLTGTSSIGLEGSQSGYTIVNFVLMYLIGCALRDLDDEYDRKRMKPRTAARLLVLNIAVLFIWMVMERSMMLIKNPATLVISNRYQNPLVISEAVLYFLLFKQLKIKNNQVINSLAAAAFPSYLIHINLLQYCGIPQAAHGDTVELLAHVIGCVSGIYFLSWVLFNIYTAATDPLFRRLDQKWTKFRKYTVE
jgi:surface polysaccharide O-acyltransferase-like enzyme